MYDLAGRSILITRSRHQASELAVLLEALGATTILLPTIEIVPPSSFAALDKAIASLGEFDWLVFTSVNAVEAFHLRSAHHTSHALAHIPTAAIGPATARAATKIGLNVALIPPQAVAESLSTALLSRVSVGSRILLVRAAVARDHLPETLTAAGCHVTIAEGYQTRKPTDSAEALLELFTNSSNFPDAITFASSSAVNNFVDLLEIVNIVLPPSIVRASIGPITTEALRDRGISAHVQAFEPCIPALAESLAEYMAGMPKHR